LKGRVSSTGWEGPQSPAWAARKAAKVAAKLTRTVNVNRKIVFMMIWAGKNKESRSLKNRKIGK
jgi:hypothetical protein